MQLLHKLIIIPFSYVWYMKTYSYNNTLASPWTETCMLGTANLSFVMQKTRHNFGQKIRKDHELLIKPDSYYTVVDEWQNIISVDPKLMVQ